MRSRMDGRRRHSAKSFAPSVPSTSLKPHSISEIGCSSMWTAGPAARSPHSFSKLRAHPFYMLPPCLIFFDRDGPADPLIAGQRRYVFPRGACPGVGRERLSKIIWGVMNDSSRHLNSCHRGISPGVGLRADSSAC